MLDLRRVIVLVERGGDWWDRTGDIASYQVAPGGAHVHVRYADSPKVFNYGARSVQIYSGAAREPIPAGAAVEVMGAVRPDVTEIWRFDGAHTRVFYRPRETVEAHASFPSADVRVVANASNHASAQRTIDYWQKVVAAQAPDDPLRWPFKGLDFVHPDSVLAGVLSDAPIVQRSPGVVPIFPFRSNLSQREAIAAALGHSISVIAGPPGTGKTETILNLLATILTMKQATVGVVSYGNSAVENVRDKLTDEGYGFVLAELGSKEKVTQFFQRGGERRAAIEQLLSAPSPDPELASMQALSEQLAHLQAVERTRAGLLQEIAAYRLELQHFEQHLGHGELPDLERLPLLHRSSDSILDYLAETELKPAGHRPSLLARVRRYVRYGRLRDLDPDDTGVVLRLQHAFYHRKIEELEIVSALRKHELDHADFNSLLAELQQRSHAALRRALAARYRSAQSITYNQGNYRFGRRFGAFLHDNPVLLSTCHSLRGNLADGYLLDYLIIDEASQVNVLAAALALSACRNVVVVGDRQQLPHIPPAQPEGLHAPVPAFDCRQHNILSMLDAVYGPSLPMTLLREHYRCDPAIIGYCNKAFYRDQLVAYTATMSDQPMVVHRSAEGNHMRQHRAGGRTNQREIDIIRAEVIPQHCKSLPDSAIGVMAPYRRQVDKVTHALATPIGADTVHKYQGRQKDVVIFSTVLDETWKGHRGLEFVDDPHLVNVAVSRAVKQFVLVTNNDLLPKSRHLRDLIGYIRYHNPDQEVIDSEIVSIFDLLYKQYSAKLQPLADRRRRELPYDSEDIALTMIDGILAEVQYAHLTVSTQILLRNLLRDLSRLTPRQLTFVRHRASVDFVVYNRITNRPLLAIEVDGFAYHEDDPDQLARDALKDQILRDVGLAILRLPTTGSGEEERIRRALNDAQTAAAPIDLRDGVRDPKGLPR